MDWMKAAETGMGWAAAIVFPAGTAGLASGILVPGGQW